MDNPEIGSGEPGNVEEFKIDVSWLLPREVERLVTHELGFTDDQKPKILALIGSEIDEEGNPTGKLGGLPRDPDVAAAIMGQSPESMHALIDSLRNRLSNPLLKMSKSN